LFLIWTITAWSGETNSISDLIVTNKFGDVFRGMTLDRVAADGLLLKHSSGLVKATWMQLPEWCRKQYQAEAAQRQQLDQEAGHAARKFIASESTRAKQADLANEAETRRRDAISDPKKSKTEGEIRLVRGKVIEKCEEGLIILSIAGPEVSVQGYDKPLRAAAGKCLLRNYSGAAGAIIGQEISIPAADSGRYPIGSDKSGKVRSLPGYTAL
jgi:hypothetical protein